MADFHASLYAYPWDIVGDRDAAAEIRDAGFGDVTIAAAYHSVRAATPRHPRHRVVEAEAATYFPIRETAWAGQRLIPTEGTPWAGQDAFAAARDTLVASEIRVRAWVVATHSTGAGSTAPELCVRNAFGDGYPYALCPSRPEVVSYARTLVTEAAELCAVDTMIIEACGPLGVSHQSRHEKTAGADWSATDEALLSICFCAVCSDAYRNNGIQVDDLRQRVQGGVGSDAHDVNGILQDDAGHVLSVRAGTTSALRAELTSAARRAGIRDLSFFASPDPWAVGPNAALSSLLGEVSGAPHGVQDASHDQVDGYVIDAWAPDSSSTDRIRSAAQRTSTRLGAYSTILPPTPADPDLLTHHWSSLLEAGASELHVYHGGLASTERLKAAGTALTHVRESFPDTPRAADSPPSEEFKP